MNFANRTVGFATMNQTLTSVLTEVTSATTMLKLSGTLIYGPGTNGFSGGLVTSGLSGTASGVFYGPTANELGGTFFLRGSAATLIGGFGGKRQ